MNMDGRPRSRTSNFARVIPVPAQSAARGVPGLAAVDRDEPPPPVLTIAAARDDRREFRPATWRAFRRQVPDGEPAEAVAAEPGPSANAVLIAKSRDLRLF